MWTLKATMRWWRRRTRPDADWSETSKSVVHGVRPALILLDDRDAIGVPAVGTKPTRLGERQARVVTKLRAWNALDRVFLIERRPLSREVYLRLCRRERTCDRDQQDDCCRVRGTRFHVIPPHGAF
jgi:hypothetical protein